jgi:hypothetical protein
MNSTAAAREEVQRVSVDTINDWKRIKSNFSSAAFAALDEILETSGSSVDKNALLPHIDQVWLCLAPGLHYTKLTCNLPAQFIQRTFEVARANVRVNGRNLDEVPEAEESASLFDRRWSGVLLMTVLRF